jgi:hypothetical protein
MIKSTTEDNPPLEPTEDGTQSRTQTNFNLGPSDNGEEKRL